MRPGLNFKIGCVARYNNSKITNYKIKLVYYTAVHDKGIL